MELAALGKVAILVPLPWSGGAEQQENARWLAQNGGAIVLAQRGLTPETLKNNIEVINKNLISLQARANAFALRIPRDGVDRLMTEIEHILDRMA